jgi:Undecaprenyl-phosphate galactose phosphotransferase WbaP
MAIPDLSRLAESQDFLCGQTADKIAAQKVLNRPNIVATGTLFFLADNLSLVMAAVLAQVLWTLVNPHAPSLLDLWPAIFFFWVVFYFNGLYPSIGMTPVEQFRRIVRGTALIYLILVTSVFLMKQSEAYSRGALTLAGIFSILLVPFTRALVCQAFSPRPWWGAPIIVLGASKTAQLLIRELQAKRAIGFAPVACLDDDPAKLGDCAGVPVIGPLSIAAEIAQSCRIRYAILAMPGLPRQKMLSILEQCSAVFPHVLLIPDLFGISTLWVSARDLSGVLGLELQYNLLIPMNRWIKRFMDLLLGSLALLLSLPLIVVCALGIKLVSAGPAFYFQEREGFGTRTIRIPKLRTMRLDADAVLAAYLINNPEASAEWSRHCKLKDDPRILPWFGKFLRRTSIDELPQLWHVITGELSLVGPRPLPAYHTARFNRDFRALRRRVTPGLTGLWQINGRSSADLEAQLHLDSYYIANWSVWLDIYILSRTARAIIRGNGAY